MSAPAKPPQGVHAMIHHLIQVPADRRLVKDDDEALFDRFGVPAKVRPVLHAGGRDDIHALGVHPNLIMKWLIWSGRTTIKGFPISYYFDRR
jgi:2'-aminobiphenyl-2,3-diol 1,2-dioxygenase small subunit